jgi:hypothetical protein
MKVDPPMRQENRMFPLRLERWARALAALGFAVVVASCGGAGEVGSGGTGAALGTVTGFGSIFVDGVRFDDSSAAVQVENLAGGLDRAEAKLGQRVEVDYEVEGVAQTVTVAPEIVGPVSAVDVGAGALVVLGQSVVVNGDPAAGPVTQFGNGYSSLADVQVGHFVEIHGVPKLAAAGRFIQATRIDKIDAAAFLRVGGVVSNLTGPPSAQTFLLGTLTVDASSALVLPSSQALAEGQSVVVFATLSSLTTGGAGAPRLAASLVRIRHFDRGPVPAFVGGLVSGLSATSFVVDGVTVHFDPATVILPPGATLADAQYVQVRGDFAADGSLTATQVKVRDGRPGGEPQAELLGTITGYDPATQSFRIRDVAVSAAGLALDASCSTGLANDLFVAVKGTLDPTGVVATEIKCAKVDPPGAIVERRGVASGVDAAGKTFVLTPAGSATAITVRWTALTFIRDLPRDPAAWPSGTSVRVEGWFTAGNTVLVATKIRTDK